MIAIHQSQFLPWAPYISKIVKSDLFVILDDVQFQKNGVQNRNMIKTPTGAQWVTVAVNAHLGDPINEVKVSNPSLTYRSLLKTLELNYRKSKYFELTYGWIEKVCKQGITSLKELNQAILSEVLIQLECKTEILYSSSMGLTKSKDELVIEIIKKTGQSQYLSGKGALDYMDLEKFKAAGIEVYLSKFSYKPYPQLWSKQSSFIPDLSVADLFFNALSSAKEYILKNSAVERIC